MDLNLISKKELRAFGAVLGGILLLIGYLHLRKGHASVFYVLTIPGGIIEIISWVFPAAIKPIYKILTPVLKAIGWINTRLLLGIVFYFLITPIGILVRFLMRKDLLFRKLDEETPSYWILRDGQPFDAKHYEKQF